MPIGFAKSVFTTSADGGVAGAGNFFATQGTAVIKADSGSDQFSNTAQTGNVWFRIDAGDDVVYTDSTGHDTWDTSSTNEFGDADGLNRIISAQANLTDSFIDNNGKGWRVGFEASGTNMAQGWGTRPDDLGAGAVVTEPGRKSGGPYQTGDFGRKSQFYQDFADRQWHCMTWSVKDAGTGSTATGGLYIDGVKYADALAFGNGTTNATMASFRYLFLGGNHTQASDTFDNSEGAEFPGDIGPIWWDASYIDLTNSTNLAKFYDAGNTDGYVDLGTDGTASGLSQPDIYIYQSGTSSLNLQSGGTTSCSFTTLDGGSNSIVVGAGPGSGVTRSNRGIPS